MLISSYLLGKNNERDLKHYDALQKLAKALYFIETLYVDPKQVSSDRIVNSALSGILSSLDPHTAFLPKTLYQQTKEDPQNKNEAPSIESQALGNGLYYLRLASFQEKGSDTIKHILANAGTSLSSLILDLRNNPGGLFDQAVKIADLFIESGLIVSTVGRDSSQIEREFATKKANYRHFPMVVLVNQRSASASEILAGALQDHKRALILGRKTFGKGSVQSLISLPDGSGIKLTVARYFTPADRSIQAIGIEPDILIPEKKPDAAPGERESDLKRHLLATDLSDFAKTHKRWDEMNAWPDRLQKDYELITAYSYLKGFLIFSGKTKP